MGEALASGEKRHCLALLGSDASVTSRWAPRGVGAIRRDTPSLSDSGQQGRKGLYPSACRRMMLQSAGNSAILKPIALGRSERAIRRNAQGNYPVATVAQRERPHGISAPVAPEGSVCRSPQVPASPPDERIQCFAHVEREWAYPPAKSDDAPLRVGLGWAAPEEPWHVARFGA